MDRKSLQSHAADSYRWIRTRLQDDGAWRGNPPVDVAAYYKAPWCFAASGDPQASRLSLAHIEANYLREDGDLEPIHNQILLERHPLYPHAYVIIGALSAGRTNLAGRILDFMTNHRHAGLGAWGDRIETGERQRFDSVSTSCAGLAFLQSGRLDEAHGAATFLERLLDLQPDPENVFYSSTFGNGELITEFPDSRAALDRRIRIYGRFQVWWAISFPLIFLARFAGTRGEKHWLGTARRYLSLLDRSRQSWDDLSAGKAAWGCALLYRLTGDPGYRARAFTAARAIVSRLARDGGWNDCINGEGGTSDAPTVMGYEVSTEFALLMALISEAVTSGDGVAFTAPSRMDKEGTVDRWTRQFERCIFHQLRIKSYRWHTTRLGKWLNSR